MSIKKSEYMPTNKMIQIRNILQGYPICKGQDCYRETYCNYKCNHLMYYKCKYKNCIAMYCGCCYSELHDKSIKCLYTKINLHNITLKYTPSFMLQIKDQHKYYNLVCNKYIRPIFNYIKNKHFIFYLKYDDKNDFNTTLKYYTNKQKLNFKDFKCNTKFKHYTSFPFKKFNDTLLHNVDEKNVGFTITDMDLKPDIKSNQSRCCTCGYKYGAGFWFTGLAYNTGLDIKPIEYDGYINTYNFFKCKCDKIGHEIKCSDATIPFFTIKCTPLNNKHHINRSLYFI